MHLSDQQLLEVDESGLLHIGQCSECCLRANNLRKMRLNLQAMPALTSSSKGWNDVQKFHKERQQSIEINQVRLQLKRWKVGSLALAASLLAMIIWPNIHLPPTELPIKNQHLSLLIQQNQKLQQQLDSSSQVIYSTSVSYQVLQMDLQSIDQAIQRAYLEGANDDSKSKLWIKRKQLMNQLLSGTKKIQPLRI